nr:Holliday junction branch migration protein RuvA [Leucobacter weissii]
MSAGAGWVVVGVGGVGLRVEVPGRIPGLHPGEPVALHTQLVVREDSLTLFGFASESELEVFGILLGVSGVGPRSALGVLTELTPAQIAAAAAQEDEKPFRKVSGIGPKTAKLIAVQLGGKLDPRRFANEGLGPEADADGKAGSEDLVTRVLVTQGLIGLGYAEAQAETAVQDAVDAGAPADQAGLLRSALALLQAPRGGARAPGAGGASGGRR